MKDQQSPSQSSNKTPNFTPTIHEMFGSEIDKFHLILGKLLCALIIWICLLGLTWQLIILIDQNALAFKVVLGLFLLTWLAKLARWAWSIANGEW